VIADWEAVGLVEEVCRVRVDTKGDYATQEAPKFLHMVHQLLSSATTAPQWERCLPGFAKPASQVPRYLRHRFLSLLGKAKQNVHRE
jgi:hypothetical protein